jgi:molybdopterin-dependent oxidoreductase-like protein
VRSFTYERVADPRTTCAAAAHPDSMLIRGGTNLIDLTRLEIERPAHLVDVSRPPLTAIEKLPQGQLGIGASARNSEVAANPIVRTRYPATSTPYLSTGSMTKPTPSALRGLASSASADRPPPLRTRCSTPPAYGFANFPSRWRSYCRRCRTCWERYEMNYRPHTKLAPIARVMTNWIAAVDSNLVQRVNTALNENPC